jgi:hypothetical protein
MANYQTTKLELRRSWATLSEVQSVIPFHVECYESVLEKCMACPSSVKTGEVTFATQFVAAYMFLKVKGCRPMQWRRQPFKSGGDFRAVKARDTSRGVQGDAPPENF